MKYKTAKSQNSLVVNYLNITCVLDLLLLYFTWGCICRDIMYSCKKQQQYNALDLHNLQNEFFFANLLQLGYVLRISGVNISIQVISKHLHWVHIWALTWPLQKMDYVSLKWFCCRFTSVFMVIVLLHYLTSSELQSADIHSDIILLNT